MANALGGPLPNSRERIQQGIKAYNRISNLARNRHHDWEERFDAVYRQLETYGSAYGLLHASFVKAERSIALRFEADGPFLRLIPKQSGMISVQHNGEEVAEFEPENLKQQPIEDLVADFVDYAMKNHPKG